MSNNYYSYPTGTPHFGTHGSYPQSFSQPGAPAPPQPQAYSMPQYNYPMASQDQHGFSGYQGRPAVSVAPAASGYYAAPVSNASVFQAAQSKKDHETFSNDFNKPETTTYTGYDAALYNAAKHYLAAKNTGQTDQWLQGGKKGAYATSNNNTTIDTSSRFGSDRYGNRSSGGMTNRGGSWQSPRRGGGAGSFGGAPPSLQHYCDVCKISCGAAHTYREHLEGKMHKKKVEMAKIGPITAAKSKNTFFCEVCDVLCTGTDAYQAHIRGQKHLKTIKLHQQLGKPIPGQDSTIIGPGGEAKKVIVVPRVNFVGGEKLISTATVVKAENGKEPASKEEDDSRNESRFDDSSIQPVGEDYLEMVKIEGGRVTAYNCKLCDCRFTDMNAKDMHMKGRRHRMNYKKKVDPSLEVDIKFNPKLRRQQDDKIRKDLMRMRQADIYSMRAMYQSQMSVPATFGIAPAGPQPNIFTNTAADRYIMNKHSALLPTSDETSRAQRLVLTVEKALKLISDDFSEEHNKNKSGENVELTAASEDRLLKGVMRVGDLAKQLVLKGDNCVELIALCSQVPTKMLLDRIFQMLPEKLKTSSSEEQFDVLEQQSEAAICVFTVDPRFELKIIFTSVVVRENEISESATETKASDALDKQKCLEALASLRHAKWFQARCANSQQGLIILRILKDLRQRVATWAVLKDWSTELLVEKFCNCNSPPHTAFEVLRRVFEGISSGILFKSGPGLLDPCEKNATDILDYLTPQQRDDLTASAQHYLRLSAFGKIYQILGVEKAENDTNANGDTSGARKRPRETVDVEMTAEESNGKKDKKV